MNDISDAADLLTTARDVLMNELLPTLTKDQRYTGLMITNALGIVAREGQLGRMSLEAETARLQELLVRAGDSGRPPDACSLPELQHTLCAAIRCGTFDQAEHRQALMTHLRQTASDWVAVSNPKALRSKAVV